MEYLFEGNISVKACILAGKRKVTKVLVDKEKIDKDTSFILAKAYERQIPVEKVDRAKIDELASGNTHGGLICFGEERTFSTIGELKGKKFLCLLEGIEDPFNFGYCLRSLMAVGCDGVIVNKRNWYASAGTISKSSAGASEYLNVYETDDIGDCLKELKSDYTIYSANRKDAISLYEADLTKPCIIAIGGEKRGLSKAVGDYTDKNIYIPYRSDFRNALNACSAASVIAFEFERQNLL